MKNDDRLSKEGRNSFQDGVDLLNALLVVLIEWPIGEYSTPIPLYQRAAGDQERVQHLLLNIERWINSLGINVLPRTVHDKRKLKDILSRLKNVVLEIENKEESHKEASKIMNEALSLIRSVPPPPTEARRVSHERRTIVANQAIILLHMNPGQPGPKELCDAIKVVCRRFGIQAFHADDIQHPDRITDVVLQYIAESEFVIAVLTNAGPNVDYEVGYAHALNVRPILFREAGTELHFNLSLHNVPEYKDLVELKSLLHQRLEAIFGRVA